MLDEKLYALIRQYGIYDTIGGIAEPIKQKGFFGKLYRMLRLSIGGINLIWALNKALDKVNDTANVALWSVNVGRKYLGIGMWFNLLSPKNRKKIRFVIQQSTEASQKEYRGCTVLSSGEIGKYPIDAIVITLGKSDRHMWAVANFPGEIIDMNSLIWESRFGRFLLDAMKQHPYVDIFVARHYRDQATEKGKRQLWHKRLIAHYLRARDFLRAGEEIEAYVQEDYGDAGSYCAFWKEIGYLFAEIQEILKHREQRDVFIYWLDGMEKEDFFSMKWVGNTNNGVIFHRAYTTMTYTKMVLRSIFTGKNVKDGKLFDLEKIELQDTIFSGLPAKKREVHAFSGAFWGKLGEGILRDSAHYLGDMGKDAPFMLCMWYALDRTLTSSSACVNFVHCMETHSFYPCGELSAWPFGIPTSAFLAVGQSLNTAGFAQINRTYIDRQLAWYYSFTPPKSVNIYMSDHGREQNLTEQNVNMPFKLMGRNILPRDELRLFSYKNMHKLINCLLDFNLDWGSAFSDYVVVDVLDPYDKSYEKVIREQAMDNFCIVRNNFDVGFLKKYLQMTKIITGEGEYYTVNILGEETYYRDKECKVNLADNPAYAKRIAVLRGQAGKFHNPWKKNRKVAIEFYESLGIQEKDILDQCY